MEIPVWWWQQVLLDNKTGTNSIDGKKREREKERERERGKE